MSNLTAIELRAEHATKLAAFPINFHEVRSQIKLLLNEVQRYGFFDEYTNHSFDHVTAMLEMVEWIIPEQTKKTLKDADFLLLTLSIYFHDLGLLISRKEFEARNSNAAYLTYIKEQSYNSGVDAEYNAKLDMLTPEKRDQVNYQEFVRFTHGSRVKEWILGAGNEDDKSTEIRDAIQGLIGKLDIIVRRDFALLCESHTIDDISDASKYRVSMPYGNNPQETANLQYIAIILRTVDLLQITSGRAPSVLYKVISPQDPVSQLEWQKQGAVRTVRFTPGVDRDGNASASAVPDTIEIHARFEKSDGFFGLTRYIAYARTQLQACQEALKLTSKSLPNPPLFPWTRIDDSGVAAEGFLTKAFEFKLDQEKILDLLTGHTLYNDTNVVVRELTQNALDAVRLQAVLMGVEPETFGEIEINWNSKDRTLEVVDNGTGMSQSVIEEHLLKVGSSRYQDSKFRELYPDFSSISRFGIGVLSAFMVSDQVEIITCSPDEDEARQISLRSVHGKYLIKLLDKNIKRKEIGVYPNGSRVKLTLRSTANIENVLEIASMWLLFPRCKVQVRIDDQEPVLIGYESPKEAIEKQLDNSSINWRGIGSKIQVRQVEEDGVTLAFAVKTDDLYKDWSFLVKENSKHHYENSDEDHILHATCIEGVGVEFNTPGFKDEGILAIANIVGSTAPKTNVARSAIEDTAEYRATLQKIYRLYTKHITDEINRLANTQDYSLSRSVEQAPYIAAALLNDGVAVIRPQFLSAELDKVPFILLEEKGERKTISFAQLCDLKEFWTINSSLNNSVEYFVREAAKDITAAMILRNLQDESSGVPDGAIFCNFGTIPHLNDAVRDEFEPVYMIASESARRVIMRWERIVQEPKWVGSVDLITEVGLQDRRFWILQAGSRDRRAMEHIPTSFAVGEVSIENIDGYSELMADRHLYLHPGDKVSEFLRRIWKAEGLDYKKRLLVI